MITDKILITHEFFDKMPKKRVNYECIRCGYETDSKSHMQKHLMQKIKPCPQTMNDIELTDEIKEYIINNRVYRIPKTEILLPTKAENVLAEEIKKLKLNIEFIKSNKKESFYQRMVETYLKGTHLKLPSGITDVSTDRIHAEIKNVIHYKSALGQLYCYNRDSPRPVLQVYLFGKAPNKTMKTAYEHFTSLNIELYTFTSVDDTHSIVKYDTGDIVYSVSMDDIV